MAVEALLGAKQAAQHMQSCMSAAVALLEKYKSAKVEQEIIKGRFSWLHDRLKEAQDDVNVVSHLKIERMPLALVKQVKLQIPHACMTTF